MNRSTYEALGGEGHLRGINWSRLRHIRRSPLHYLAALADETRTRALDDGILHHTRVLEPHKLRERLAVYRGASRRGSKAYSAWAEAHEGKIILCPRTNKKDREAFDLLRGMTRVLRRHPKAMALLQGGRSEVPLYWAEEIDGVEVTCKGLADYVIPSASGEQASALGVRIGQPILVDLKFLRDLDRLDKTVGDHLYHGQAAHYATGVSAPGEGYGHCGQEPAVFLVCVEKSPPHDVAVLRLTDALEAGHRLRSQLLSRLVQCVTNDEWPGAHPGVVDVQLKPWAAGVDTDEPI